MQKHFWRQCHWQCCQPKVYNIAKTRWFGPLSTYISSFIQGMSQRYESLKVYSQFWNDFFDRTRIILHNENSHSENPHCENPRQWISSNNRSIVDNFIKINLLFLKGDHELSETWKMLEKAKKTRGHQGSPQGDRGRPGKTGEDRGIYQNNYS